MSNQWDIHKFADKIYNYSRNNIISVVLRHSIREEISDTKSIRAAPLTNEGRELAYEFGELLPKDRFIRIFHSSVQRCKETAELIYQGFRNNNGSGSVIGEQKLLGGFFMLNRDLALDIMFDLGGSGFIEEWFKERIDRTIMGSPKKATNDMINSIIGCNRNNLKEIDIHVSHDINIILLKALLFDVLSEDFRWPGFMEGVILKKENRQITVYIEDKEKIIYIE